MIKETLRKKQVAIYEKMKKQNKRFLTCNNHSYFLFSEGHYILCTSCCDEFNAENTNSFALDDIIANSLKEKKPGFYYMYDWFILDKKALKAKKEKQIIFKTDRDSYACYNANYIKNALDFLGYKKGMNICFDIVGDERKHKTSGCLKNALLLANSNGFAFILPILTNKDVKKEYENQQEYIKKYFELIA